MEILLTLTYVAICVAIFKVFRIPVNQWTLTTAALGGIFGQRFSGITQTVSRSFGRTNQHLEAGEVLFKIDPKPYEYVVGRRGATASAA